MSTALELVSDELPPAVAKSVEKHAVAIDKCKSKGVALIFEIGRHLKSAHDELAKHGDGTFGKWCKERCGITHATALNHINATDAFGAISSSNDLKNFDAGALYYLSRDTTPEVATSKAIKLAKNGERITLAKAKEIVEQYTLDETGQDDEVETPDVMLLMETARTKIRAAFKQWPRDCVEEIETVLSMLLQEEHSSWLQ